MGDSGAAQGVGQTGEGGARALGRILAARLVVVTGKGGVGKTTLAAAIARMAAREGKRVLVAEVGQEPGTPSPALQALTGITQPSSLEPVQAGANIDCVLLTPEAGHRAFLRDVLPIGFIADFALKAEPLKRFLQAAPAFSELGVLYRGLQFVRMERRKGLPLYDLVLIDSPATGHAIAFASLPEQMLKIIPGGPIGRTLKEGSALLTDPAKTVALVTTLPETLPVSEALELIEGLGKHRIDVAAVVANLVPHDPFSAGEHQELADYFGQASPPGAVLGGRSVGRLRRAQEALGRLRERVGGMLVTVDEHDGKGPGLVDAVARELAGVLHPAPETA